MSRGEASDDPPPGPPPADSLAGANGAGGTRRRVRGARSVLLLFLGLAPLPLVLGTPLLETHWAGAYLLVAGLIAFGTAHRLGATRDRTFLALWVAAAVALAVVSAFTGLYNGLTDEAFATPAFRSLGWQLYTNPIQLVYTQYGAGPFHETLYFVYLPLLPWLFVPGLNYRWVTLGAWAASLFLLRRNGTGLVLFGAPWVGVLAASGFNDFVPLAFLTLALVPRPRAGNRVAEVIALGLKQFANVVVVGYLLFRRRWREAGIATLITIAFLLPFLLIDPSGVWCHALLVEPGACGGGSGPAYGAAFGSHINYYVWPVWLVAFFGPAAAAVLRGPGYAPDRAAVEAALGPRAGRSVWALPLVALARLFHRLGFRRDLASRS